MTTSERIGHVAMELIDEFNVAHEGGDDAEVGDVMLIVESNKGDMTGVFSYCTDGRPHLKLGLVEAVAADLRTELSGLSHLQEDEE